MKKIFELRHFFLLALILGSGMMVSCDSDELEDPSFDNIDDELNLTASASELQLQEQFINNQLTFNWSTGTNKGTGAAIAYTLQIDLAGNDFSDPLLIPVEAEKTRYSYTIDHGTLNNRLLEQGLSAGETYELQARVIADVADGDVAAQIATTAFSVTTYKPVSSQLFLVGDATPNGWDIKKATALTASTSERGVFTWEGPLTEGNFKFAVSRDDCFCQDFYTKDPNDDGIIVYNEGGSGEDLQWTVTEADNYRVRVDLLNKTFSMEPVEDAPFDQLWIVGNATESDWDIDNPAAFTRSEEDPFVFTYEGNLNPGNFKILAGETGDFCGEWYRPLEDGQAPVDGSVKQRAGCEPDYKWTVTEETAGRYIVSLNTGNNTIKFTPVNVYIVGDATPSGWDINTPQALTYENGDFVFNGDLTAGDMKFSKYVGDWCNGEWIVSAENGQSIDNTAHKISIGCVGPDNKWKLLEGDAGTYEIRINLDTDNMSITKL